MLHLLDGLTTTAGNWGAFCILAEAEENSLIVQRLIQTGYRSYGWIQIWYLPPEQPLPINKKQPSWKNAEGTDPLIIKQFICRLCPQQHLPKEIFTKSLPEGKVLYINGKIAGWAEYKTGYYGAFLKPIFDPEMTDITDCLNSLIGQIQKEVSVPIYIATSSQQEWLNLHLLALGANSLPRQALMVKRLVRTISDEVTQPVHHKIPQKSMGVTGSFLVTATADPTEISQKDSH